MSRRPAVVGGDNRQAGRGRLQESQPERFGERRIDEHAVGGHTQTVQIRNVLGRVRFGIGDLAIEIIKINQVQDLIDNLLLRARQFANVLASPHDQGQVRPLLQFRTFSISADQHRQVLPLVQSRHSQDQRLLGLVQEASEFRGDGRREGGSGRRERVQVHPRRNHFHAIGLIMVVQSVLLLHFLVGAGDNHRRRLQGDLLGLNSLGELEFLLEGLQVVLAEAHALLLDSAQGVASEDKRDPQQPGQLSAGQSGVGIVAMDNVRQALALEVRQRLIDEHVEVRPETLLAKISPRSKRNANQLRILGDRLFQAGVGGPNFLVDDLPRQQLNFKDVGLGGQRAGEFQDVFHLPAGVGVAAQFRPLHANQAMQADQGDFDAAGGVASDGFKAWFAFTRLRGLAPGAAISGGGRGVGGHGVEIPAETDWPGQRTASHRRRRRSVS